MKNRAFHFEIKNLLTQFVAAFDDVVISRYDKNRQARQNIDVRYVFAPKQRVMYDIINKAQNITLPVVSINLEGISRDNGRVFNKLEPSYIPAQENESSKVSSKFLMPVPVNIEVSMSILARYMQDIDQIISNFVPYNNPYIILSWKVPEEFGTEYDQEIRSEVLWNGNLTYSTPTDTTYNDMFRVTVDTSFTIKGWLFPEKKSTSGNVFKIDSNFINVDLKNRIYSPLDPTEVTENLSYQQQGYTGLSSYSTTASLCSETVTVSGLPDISNLYYSSTGTLVPIEGTWTGSLTNIISGISNTFILYGKQFDTNLNFYLSSTTMGAAATGANWFSNYQKITSAKMETISGFKLTDDFYIVTNDNIASITLPPSTLSASGGKFNFVVANEAGWSSTYLATSSILNST
jgi:hypothetical protein|tara:strand:- start:294 stop:1508 length:1215 start_codon:yes stop_codon:yes gene_type:complete